MNYKSPFECERSDVSPSRQEVKTPSCCNQFSAAVTTQHLSQIRDAAVADFGPDPQRECAALAAGGEKRKEKKNILYELNTQRWCSKQDAVTSGQFGVCATFIWIYFKWSFAYISCKITLYLMQMSLISNSKTRATKTLHWLEHTVHLVQTQKPERVWAKSLWSAEPVGREGRCIDWMRWSAKHVFRAYILYEEARA